MPLNQTKPNQIDKFFYQTKAKEKQLYFELTFKFNGIVHDWWNIQNQAAVLFTLLYHYKLCHSSLLQ